MKPIFGYERVYLPLYNWADTPFNIQGDAVFLVEYKKGTRKSALGVNKTASNCFECTWRHATSYFHVPELYEAHEWGIGFQVCDFLVKYMYTYLNKWLYEMIITD